MLHHSLANEVIVTSAHAIIPTTMPEYNLTAIFISPAIRFACIPIRVEILNPADPNELTCKSKSKIKIFSQ